MNVPHASWADGYDRLYEKSFGSFYRHLTDLTLEVILTQTRPGDRVVDFGAGTGRLAIPLSRQGRQVTAVEPCAEMVEQLQGKDSGRLVHVHPCRMADFQSSMQHDFACCVFTVLLYLLDDEQLSASLKAAAASLRPGGRLLLDVPASSLFHGVSRSGPDFSRSVRVDPIGQDRYRYVEDSWLLDDAGQKQLYQDEFTIRYWPLCTVLQTAETWGLLLRKDMVHVFAGSGANYLLFERHGA